MMIIATTVAFMGFVLISVVIIAIGFVCGCWFRHANSRPYKDSSVSEGATYHRSQRIENSCRALYEEVYTQEVGLDLKENIAYVSTQQIKTQMNI